MSILFGIPVDLAYHLVCWFAAILAPLAGGLAAAAAIIAFTMLVRLALLPLSYVAVRGSVRASGPAARCSPRSQSCSGGTPRTRSGCGGNSPRCSGPKAPACTRAACRCCCNCRSSA